MYEPFLIQTDNAVDVGFKFYIFKLVENVLKCFASLWYFNMAMNLKSIHF